MLALGLIVGSGLNHWEFLNSFDTVEIETPYGAPSSPLWIGRFKGVRLVVLFRHGERADLKPSEVNYRANIYALKVSGVQKIISLESVSSLSKALHAGQFSLEHQSIDLTSNRAVSFESDFEFTRTNGDSQPSAHSLVESLTSFLLKAKAEVESGSVCLCIDDPFRLSGAEVRLFQSWNVSIIGSSLAAEEKLSQEAQLEYLHVGMVTDQIGSKVSSRSTFQALNNRTSIKMTATFKEALTGLCAKLASHDVKIRSFESGRAKKGLSRDKRDFYQLKSTRDSNRTRRKQTSR